MSFTTKKSLLARVRAGDEVSWKEFYDNYRPLIILCGRDCGLTQDENEELVQLVMKEIFQKDILVKYNPDNIPSDVVFQYDPSKGRFRHYLRAIIRNQALKLYHKRTPFVNVDYVPDDSAENQFDAIWEDEWRRHLYTQSMTELRSHVQPETYTAFEMYAIQGRPVNEVAEFLSMTINSVYVAKNRCVTMLKQIIASLDMR